MEKRTIMNLRLQRVAEDKTQLEVARDMGFSRQYLHRLEVAETSPSNERKEQLSEYFGKSSEFLFSVAE